MGPHYRVPREPEQPPRLGRRTRGTWLALAVITLVIAVTALVVVFA